MRRIGPLSAVLIALAGMTVLAGCGVPLLLADAAVREARLGGAGVGPAPTLGPAFHKMEAPEGAAVIYVSRPSKFMNGRVFYHVRADGVLITTLYNGMYYAHVAKPGKIEFSAKTEATSSVTLDVEAGEVYYVRGSVGLGFLVPRPNLEVVPREVGEKEILETKLMTFDNE